MKPVRQRISLLFEVGRQWLTAAPRNRGALLCGLSAIGAMIAIGYNAHKSTLPPPTPVVPTSDVGATRDFATSNELGASSTRDSLPKNRIEDAEMVEPSPVNNSRSGKEGPSPRAIALDKSFLVTDTDDRKAAIRDQDEVNKTANKPAKKPQRRVSSDRDRKFSPSREIKRAGDKITKLIRDIL